MWSTFDSRSAWLRRLNGDGLERGEHLVDDPVFHGLLGGQVLVTLDVTADLLGGFAGVGGEHFFHQGTNPQDLFRLYLDVGRLTVAPFGGRLVDQDPAVRQGEPLAFRTGGQDHGRGRSGLTQADGPNIGLDVAHRVVDRRQGGE